MIRFNKFLVAGLLLPVLGACSTYDLSKYDSMEQQGNAFDQALHKEYMELAYAEAAEDDWADALFFADRAASSANGESVSPQLVEERDIQGDDKDLLEGVRSGLVDALVAGREAQAPIAARAQAMFDCWLQEREENFQPDHIARCREEFDAAYAQLGSAAAAPAAPAAEPASQAGPFLVFFDFDSDALDKAALALVESIAANEVAMDENANIVVAGHADRSGSDEYNAALSEQRAISVSIALQLAGVKGEVVMQSFGEGQPLKATDDGVREPKNRRVEIKMFR